MAIGWTLRDAILGHPAHVDNPAKPYSLRGPIYVPISGRGTITRGLTTDTIRRGQVGNILSFDAGKKTVTLKRNKSTLGGREVCEDGTPRCEAIAVAKALRPSSDLHVVEVESDWRARRS